MRLHVVPDKPGPHIDIAGWESRRKTDADEREIVRMRLAHQLAALRDINDVVFLHPIDGVVDDECRVAFADKPDHRIRNS